MVADLHGQGPPVSTLADVIDNVEAQLAQIGALRATADDGSGLVEWLVSETYLDQEGIPPRILVVPDQDPSAVGGPDRIGAGNFIAGVTEKATFYCWGDTADDANALLMRVLNALKWCAGGRINGIELKRPVKSNVERLGVEKRLVISYFWNVPTDAAIWNQPAATPVSPPDPMRPNGPSPYAFQVKPDATTGATR